MKKLKPINTRKCRLNNNDRISSKTESASLSSFDASSLEQTLPPFFPIEVNPNSIELYLNSLERNYGAYGNNNNHHSWTLMNYGSPTIKNSSLSSSCRRKVDCGEDSNRAIKNQKIQKTTVGPWKENIDAFSSFSSSLSSKDLIECPGTPPNQIRSINDMKTPDTAFSLSEYLNMSPMQ
ncbi:3777_t:CDS:2 [Entrophospora sp. SA101]|nr:3777_t:CDS:2 [Entrophospora sp. SA101]